MNEIEKYKEQIQKELFGTIHKEEVVIVETVVDLRIVLKDWVVVLDKISGKFSILRKELIFGDKK